MDKAKYDKAITAVDEMGSICKEGKNEIKEVIAALCGVETSKFIDLREINRGKFQECTEDISGNGNAIIDFRSKGNYSYQAFYLNSEYNWNLEKDNHDVLILVPTKKNVKGW